MARSVAQLTSAGPRNAKGRHALFGARAHIGGSEPLSINSRTYPETDSPCSAPRTEVFWPNTTDRTGFCPFWQNGQDRLKPPNPNQKRREISNPSAPRRSHRHFDCGDPLFYQCLCNGQNLCRLYATENGDNVSRQGNAPSLFEMRRLAPPVS